MRSFIIYCSPNFIRAIKRRWIGGTCRTIEEIRRATRDLVGKLEGKGTL
jgi:hypothetical protein